MALSAAGLLYSWLRFAPAALGSPDLTPYTKNHIVRELIFGGSLSAYVIFLCAAGRGVRDYWITLCLGAVIVAVFWVGAWTGFGLDGLDQIWQGGVTRADAYRFHVPQTVVFLLGAVLMVRPVGSRRPITAGSTTPPAEPG